MLRHRNDPTLAIRALKSAAPYIRLYKGKTFVVKAGGGVFSEDVSARQLIEQLAILHYLGITDRAGTRRRSAGDEAVGCAGTVDAHGRRAPRHECRCNRCHLDGAQRTDQHADSGAVP